MTDIFAVLALRFPTYKPNQLINLLQRNGIAIQFDGDDSWDVRSYAKFALTGIRAYPEWIDDRAKLLASAPNLAQAAIDGDLRYFLQCVDRSWPEWPSNPAAVPSPYAGFTEGSAAEQARAQAAADRRRGRRRHSRGSDQRRAVRTWARWCLTVCRDGPDPETEVKGQLFHSFPSSFRSRVASFVESELASSPPEKYPWIHYYQGGHVFNSPLLQLPPPGTHRVY
jgi:hypothetical protein